MNSPNILLQTDACSLMQTPFILNALEQNSHLYLIHSSYSNDAIVELKNYLNIDFFIKAEELNKNIEVKKNIKLQGKISIFTSGSTNKPKIITHPIEKLIESAKCSIKYFKMQENDSSLLSLPLSHIAGVMIFLRSFLSKGILCWGKSKNFDLTELKAFFINNSVDFASFVLPQLYIFNELENNQNLIKKALLLGGQFFPEHILKKTKAPIHLCYGMTETGSQIAINSSPIQSKKYHFLNHINASISKDGKIQVSGCFHHITEDKGIIDKEGRLELMGREKNIVIKGGENIYLDDIHSYLLEHPDIINLLLIPMPHIFWGEIYTAIIVSKNSLISTNELKKYLKQRYSSFIHPQDFIILDQSTPFKLSQSIYFNSRPLVSIIIPVFNRYNSLELAINSIIKQSYPLWELIIVDDGSIKSTYPIVEEFKHIKSIRYLRIPRNKGVSFARNLGAKISNGTYLAFLDSDDQWLPDKLFLQIPLLGKYQWAHCNEIWIRNGKRINQRKIHEKKQGDIFSDCIKICVVSPSAVIIKKDIFFEAGGFDISFPVCEDYYLWLKLANKYPIGLVQDNMVIKTGGHQDQLSTQFKAMDYYRVKALVDILKTVENPLKKELIYKETYRKYNILEKGYIKYNNTKKLEEIKQWRIWI